MLEDRDYMRQPDSYTPRVSWAVVLIIANAVAFIGLQVWAKFWDNGLELQNQYLALSLDGIRHGYVWQFLTFQFMHAGWMHLLGNSLFIYFFGRSVETVLGRNRFLGLYFLSGILGGVAQMVFDLVTHDYQTSVVGASAGACGLVAAFAVINWVETFTIFVYFFPVTMRGRTLLWISIGIAVACLLTTGSNIASVAHLGGILTGYLYAQLIFHAHWPQWNFFHRRRQSQPAREMAATRARESGRFWRSRPPQDDVPPEQFVPDAVDAILDKISAQGIQSLTAREREILEQARKKMGRS